jgi:hypothetical protein
VTIWWDVGGPLIGTVVDRPSRVTVRVPVTPGRLRRRAPRLDGGIQPPDSRGDAVWWLVVCAPAKKITGSTGRMHGDTPVNRPPTNPISAKGQHDRYSPPKPPRIGRDGDRLRLPKSRKGSA